MRLRPRSSPARTTLVMGTAALAALLVGATAAVAAPADTTGHQEPAHGSAASGSPPASPGCADPLVTFAREGTVGDDRAVAITAQALERGVDGWQLLAWQVQAGTTLTQVVATGIDGELRELSPTTAGTVEDVLSLAFCGSHGAGAVAAGSDATVPAGGATTEPEPAAAPTETPPAAAPTEAEPATSTEAEPAAAPTEALPADTTGTDPPAATNDPSAGVTDGHDAPEPPGTDATPPPGDDGASSRDPGGAPDDLRPARPQTAPLVAAAVAGSADLPPQAVVAATGHGNGWRTPVLVSLLAVLGLAAAVAVARHGTTATGAAARSMAPATPRPTAAPQPDDDLRTRR